MVSARMHDTIAAVATAPGISGIVLIRISGDAALRVADRVFQSARGVRPSQMRTHTVRYGWIVDGAERVDEVLMTVMRAPRTYTRQDVVEIGCHGGEVSARRVLELIMQAGCRPAEPGEFTLRAFLNGRIDLTQAEAVADIVNARTQAALSSGVAQLEGVLSRRLRRIRAMLLEIACGFEAAIDFPLEAAAGEACSADAAAAKLEEVAAELDGLCAGARGGRLVRDGMRVVICGRPNAGKSSLFNALLREERVIVTPVAGTTRDAVTATVDIRGIPVSLTDTAGIMKPRTVIEKKAVASAREACRRAHLLLLVVDGHRRITRQDTDFFRSASRLSGGQLLGVINKIDLSARADSAILARYCDRVVAVSAKKERSLHVLEDALYTCAFSGSPRAQEADILLNSRQAHLVAGARAAVVSALRHLRRGVRVEFVAQDMRDAGRQLDEALGTVYGDDVIGKIFSRFCIGK